MTKDFRQTADLSHQAGSTSSSVASGYGKQAEQIIALAQSEGVPVHAAPELMTLLMQLDLDESISEDLYAVIAEILIWAQALTNPVGE
ncbi:EscU/YscU/HrcU family type III secretion system export apparatus switch protein [Microbulbifer sp.]|uniref:EscU/YscU/HrcU family type III secretion system export apparatus switch protein n=1 Tax=Microbulbifer sp. TaxID=1908541 RepID=UPI00258FE3EE|nr:EscU/YscU/HrcU family type III secretion system export apparatus switch protein [Microbulbifer sp.]